MMPDRDKNANSLQIHINTEVYNNIKTNILVKFWEDLSIRPYILKYSKGISQQPKIFLFIVFLFLLILYYNASEERSDGVKKEIGQVQDVDMLTKIIPTEGDGECTAILLNWNRLDNIKVIVKNLCQYSMFKEIFIWNN